MGFFSNILNGGQNQDSAAAANKYLDQIPGMAHKNLDPFNNPGEKAQGFVDQILSGYKPSTGYQFKEDKLRQGLANTAATGGFSGTQYDQGKQGELMNSLMGDDMQQYLTNVLGVHDNSFKAASQLTDVEGGGLNQQGGLAFGAAEQNNARNSSLRDALLQLAGTGVGAALGGPAGASIGGSIGGKLGNMFGSKSNGTGWGQEALFGGGGGYHSPARSTAPGANFLGR